VTRGVAPRQHAFPAHVRPTLVAFVEALTPLPAGLRRSGVTAVTMADLRWGRCDLKAIALLPNVLAKQWAIERGAHEAIFLGPGGSVREGATANVFAVHGRSLRTHPLGPEILPGVSRSVVLELARDEGLRVREARFGVAALYAADEVFLSSTVQEILPVVRIDGRRIGAGRPGPVTTALWARFRARTAGTRAPSGRRAAGGRRRARRPAVG
jgi:D-alanine transaminase